MAKGTQRFLISIFLFACLITFSYSLTFTVPPKTIECFYETVEKGTEIGMIFQVLEGGVRDISVDVRSPTDEVIYQAPNEKEGKYFFVAFVKGKFSFCFDNRASKFTSKKINIILNVGKQRSEQEIIASIISGREDAKEIVPSELSLLQFSIYQLVDGIASIQNEEKYLRLRERVHRDTTESTNSRVLGWSILEALSLISVSLWQIYYIRRFFEVKRTI